MFSLTILGLLLTCFITCFNAFLFCGILMFVSHLIRYSINLSSHVDIYIKGGCYDALQSNLIYVIASEIMWSAIFTG